MGAPTTNGEGATGDDRRKDCHHLTQPREPDARDRYPGHEHRHTGHQPTADGDGDPGAIRKTPRTQDPARERQGDEARRRSSTPRHPDFGPWPQSLRQQDTSISCSPEYAGQERGWPATGHSTDNNPRQRRTLVSCTEQTRRGRDRHRGWHRRGCSRPAERGGNSDKTANYRGRDEQKTPTWGGKPRPAGAHGSKGPGNTIRPPGKDNQRSGHTTKGTGCPGHRTLHWESEPMGTRLFGRQADSRDPPLRHSPRRVRLP